MGVSSSESHDLTAFYEMLSASFGVLSQNTGFYPSLDRIVKTMLRPLNLGPGGRSYNKPISHLQCVSNIKSTPEAVLIYNDIKADLCVYMVCQSMFISKDEGLGLLQAFVLMSKKRHGIKNYEVTMALTQMVHLTQCQRLRYS